LRAYHSAVSIDQIVRLRVQAFEALDDRIKTPDVA
jgi:hypothetical protein